MTQIVWIVVGIGALLLLGVLGYGLYGHLKRLRSAVGDARTATTPQVEALSQGIRRAQALRMPNGADTTRGLGRHA